MVALRALRGEDLAARGEPLPPDEQAADWLTVQQAACEFDVSASTVRRRVRDGRLQCRIAFRRRRRIYLIYVPGSLHAAAFGSRSNVVDLTARARQREVRRFPRDAAAHDETVERLEQQVERLSGALAPALRLHQKSLPPGVGQPDVNPADPYERYRWLARRRRWWPFS